MVWDHIQPSSVGGQPTTTRALRKIPTTADGMVHYVPHSFKSNLWLICWIYNSFTQALTNIHSLAKRQCVIKNTKSPRKLQKVMSSYKIIVLQWLLHVKTVWLPMTNLFIRKPQPRKPNVQLNNAACQTLPSGCTRITRFLFAFWLGEIKILHNFKSTGMITL